MKISAVFAPKPNSVQMQAIRLLNALPDDEVITGRELAGRIKCNDKHLRDGPRYSEFEQRTTKIRGVRYYGNPRAIKKLNELSKLP